MYVRGHYIIHINNEVMPLFTLFVSAQILKSCSFSINSSPLLRIEALRLFLSVALPQKIKTYLESLTIVFEKLKIYQKMPHNQFPLQVRHFSEAHGKSVYPSV